MNGEVPFTTKDLLILHDQKIGEQDKRHAEIERTVEGFSRDLKTLIERVNLGISPTQQKILEKSNEIQISISDLRHEFDTGLNQLRNQSEKEFAEIRVEVENTREFFKTARTIFIRGVIMVIVSAVTLTVWNKITADPASDKNATVQRSK